ncbi:MAG TPA: family 10 glycosylhydrolase [bacterium]|nr:family 10 glycosylhydrolase [bacterium]HOM26084.1 family 10 glycosylhydrolase [bacterium]
MKMIFLGILIFFLNVIKGFSYSEIDIETFNYRNISEVREKWLPQERSREVELIKEKGKKVIKFVLNFSEVEKRSYWDRFVLLDLSNFEKFVIEVKSENPSLTTNCTIYFESEGGWFSYRFPIENNSWQKIIIPKSKFVIEGNPTGWDKIKRIRISFWKIDTTDLKETSVYLRSLKGIIPDSKIGIVFCDSAIKEKGHRRDVISKYYSDIAGIFDKFEIDYKTVNQSEFEKKEIEKEFKILIFPYNPFFSEEEIKNIIKFVEKGGKIIVFYSSNQEIYKILGIENAVYRYESYPGEFDTVEFLPEIINGLPEKMKQSSWNVMVPEKISENSKIAGYWIDADGKTTGIPSAILSENGFYFSHVLLNKEEGEQFLISLILFFFPENKNAIFDSLIKNTGKLSGFQNLEEIKKFIEGKMIKLSFYKKREVKNYLNITISKYKELTKNYKKLNIEDLFKKKNEIDENLRQAYFRCFKGKEKEYRGVWCHSPFGVKGLAWEESIKKLKEANFNAIFPNMLRAGIAYYKSEFLPVAEEVKIKGDQIEECLSACKKYGIECHIWKVNWNLFNAPAEFIEKLRNEKRLQIDKNGKEVLWLCPSNPLNFKLEFDSMLEIVKKYDIDGIHFDYIRYPDANSCFCENCKKNFEREYNVKIENWPYDVINGKYMRLYKKWRQEQITKLVREVSNEARKIKPNIKISAAVFSNYPDCKETVAQDWKLWIEEGYLDFICPMDYTISNYTFKNYVKNQNEVIRKKISFYPGIGAYILSPEDIVNQIEICREIGTDGFILFDYNFTLYKNLYYFGLGITEK